VPATVLMPKLGLTMEEGRIVEWKKDEGDRIARKEILYVVETEKITYDVESPETGILGRIVVKKGETVKVGAVVAYILLPGEDALDINSGQETGTLADARVGLGKTEQIAGITKPPAEEAGKRIKVSPVARRLAEEHGIFLGRIQGTGPGERIVRKDILDAIEERRAVERAANPGAERNAAKADPDMEIVGLSAMRQVIARRMSHSFNTAPHIYFTVETDAANLIRLREDLLPHVERKCGGRLSITDLLIKITAHVLQEFPMANASWTEEGIRVFRKINIGLATALDEGLLVPVIREADKKSLYEITSIRTDITRRARERKIDPDEISGGTFTLSSLGMFGIDFFNAIINPPESAILAIGAIKEKPAVRNGEIVIRPLMYMTFTGDHRVLDGAYAARVLQRLKELVEAPLLSLL